MTTLAELSTPALVLDLDKLEANLDRMALTCQRLGVTLRPHIKTHKCVEIARLQRERGCGGLTVSTLDEARIFADHGFEDLTWAFPLILSRLEQAREIAEQVTLRLVVDSTEAIGALESLGFPFHVWLKVDCGYHRAGVDPETDFAAELAMRLHDSGTLHFDGLLTHSGHAYKARSGQELLEVATQERDTILEFARNLRSAGLEVPTLSIGSTPAMSAASSLDGGLDGIDEVRPGNYAFYDLMQVALGACKLQDCAVSVLASVVSAQPMSDHSVIDAGALAMSKDTGAPDPVLPTLGEIYDDYDAATLLEDARLISLSQEHGVVSASLPVGSKIRIQPNHSCLTVACFDEYAVVRGEEIVDGWKIWRQR